MKQFIMRLLKQLKQSVEPFLFKLNIGQKSVRLLWTILICQLILFGTYWFRAHSIAAWRIHSYLKASMTNIKVLQMPEFKRAYKRLHKNQKNSVDQAIHEITQNPLLGDEK